MRYLQYTVQAPLNPAWLIGAIFKFLTRTGVSWLAKALTPHSPSGVV